jgi:periplasmic protein TonB
VLWAIPPPVAPVRVGGEINALALVRRGPPTYPTVARLAKIHGDVIVEAEVAPDGQVESVKVLKSVKLLDDAAMAAVKQWRYSPLLLNGQAVPFVLAVTASFNLTM